jgi:DNA processing protein
VNDTLAWLQFANVELTPRAAHALLDRFGTPQAVFEADPDELNAVPELTADQLARLLDDDHAPTDAQIAWMDRPDVAIVPRDAVEYPAQLRDVADRPPALFVRGRLDERDRFGVAIVGTRRPSPYGKAIAARFAKDLAGLGLTVVSGGAMGIDTAAHRAAVGANGRTLVVLGCGLNVRYPADNQDLFDEIVARDGGAIVSEFPLGATPEAWRFPMRNRVISGLSLGVVVVEAGARSGALITASCAADQGREVLAVPGSIDSPSSEGCNALIRDGAGLVTSARETAEALGVLVMRAEPAPVRQAPPDLSEPQRKLLACLSLTPKPLDVIVEEVEMSPAEVSAQMTLLELRGLAHRQAGGSFIRLP